MAANPGALEALYAIAALVYGGLRVRRALRLAAARRHFRVTVPQGLTSPSSGYVRLEGQALRANRPEQAPVTGHVAAWRQSRFFRNMELDRFDGDRPFLLRSAQGSLQVTLDQDCLQIVRDRRKKDGPRITLERRYFEKETEEDWEIAEGDCVTLWGWCEPDGQGAITLGPGQDGATVLVLDGIQSAADRLLAAACRREAVHALFFVVVGLGLIALASLTNG